MNANRTRIRSKALATTIALVFAPLLGGCETPTQFVDRESRASLAKVRHECGDDRECFNFRARMEAARIDAELAQRQATARAVGQSIANMPNPYCRAPPQRVIICGRYGC